MTRYTLHVPETLNDGSPVRPDQLAAIESQLLDAVGGFTQTIARGAWRGSDRDYVEPIRLYLLDADDSPATSRTLQRIAREIAHELDQEAVYLTRQEIETFLVASPVAA